MKKLLLIALVFGIGLTVLSSKAQAQGYNPYIWNNNALADWSLAHAKARRQHKKKTATRKTAKRKVVRRKARRVSSLQMNEQKFKLDAYLPKRTEVV